MRLRSLEIQGFKSFPDKTRLEFKDGITAVVGPNGSGKSNIADAVRWVLGEQSTRTLRGAKMEDVIFSGTQTRKPVGYASVQLVIDNMDKMLPDQDDAITISRRLYRSGESEYRLNGVAVRLKDIHELLMDTGLGRDGYSIIGQGRIAEIVSAKSRERREIFEEAAGISKYRYRKLEAEKRLAQAEENLVRLRDILSELEGRVEPLRVQAEKAKSFLTLAQEKKELEISLWLLSLDRLKEQLATQENKVAICKNQYEQLERESDEVQEAIERIFRQSQELAVQMEDKRAQIKELEERLAKSESDTAVLQNDIHHNKVSIQRVDEELDSADLGVDELLVRLQEKNLEHMEGDRQLEEMDGRITAAEERLVQQREQSERVTGEIEELRVRRQSLESGISQIRLEQAADASLFSESESRLEALRQSSAGYDSAVEELENAVEECARQVTEQQEAIEGLGNTQKGYTLKRDSRGKKLQELQERIRTLENEAGQKRQRAKLLQDLEANMEGFAGSVKYILAQAKKGALAGVSGAVSSLISVDKAYTVAIETALGAAMQNVVVQDEEVAKRAIRMLRDARAGRATFLPMTSVRGRNMDTSALSRHQGYIGLAVDLVRCDSRYSGIMSQLLGRVAVVEDLDAGTSIAKATGYKTRIVTLDGQVINAGGSFTGGSTVRSAGVLGRRQEIEKLLADAKQIDGKAQSAAPELKAVTEELSSLDAYITGITSEMQTAQEERVRLNTQLDALRRNLEQARNNRTLAVGELEAITKRLEDLEATKTDKTQLLEDLEKQYAGLDEKLAGARSRRETLQVGAETAASALSEMRMTRLSAGKDQDLLAQEIANIQLQIDNAGTRAEQLKTEKAGYEEKNRAIAARIEELEALKEEYRADIATRNEGIRQLAEERTALEGKTTALRTQEREASGRREEVSRELARLEERRHTVQGEYDSIIAKLWDEYDMTRTQALEEAVPIEDKDKASRRLSELKGKIKALGTVNVEAIEEYTKVSERYRKLSTQVADVEKAKDELLVMIGDLTQEMRDLFAGNFSRIARNFSRIFVQLFGGGHAELVLTDEEDVLESGVEISVQPPGKVIKSLSLLSGGEQAFVSIAIYFAILHVKPAPFCLLDEIEAALDDVNVARFAGYLRQICDKTQFIAITHRRGTMEEADMLYGVTMQDEGVSKLLELKVGEVESKLGL